MSPAPAGGGHEFWEELAVGHALHSLEPEDDEVFRAHLPGCEVCARAVSDTSAVMGQLAYAAPPAEPSGRLRESIRAGLATSGRPPTVHPASSPRPQTRRRARRWWPTSTAPWMAVAAGLVVVLGLGVWNLVLRTEGTSRQHRLDRVSTVLRCLESPGCTTVPLSSQNGSASRATAVVRDNHVWLVLDGLPRNDLRTQVYVLWQKVGSQPPEAVSTFDVARPGVDVVDAGRLPGALSSTRFLAITREAGRVAPPSGSAPLLVGTPAATGVAWRGGAGRLPDAGV